MRNTAPNYEGKGAVTGRICADSQADGRAVVNVRVGGPNAGHTVLGVCPPACGDGHTAAKHPWRLRAVPVGAVTATESRLVIAAGSEVDPNVLAAEVRELDAAGYRASDRLIIDGSATVLRPEYCQQERDNRLQERIGSTAKGIGAARGARIWRHAQTWSEYAKNEGRPDIEHVVWLDTAEMLRDDLQSSNTDVVVEGTQGYGLGLHTANYPYTTSGDCRAVDFLAQAGISPWQRGEHGWPTDLKVVLAVRPHPIRVAGDSGALAGETTWGALGLPIEYTTVTNKVRRVGAWDPALVRAAVRANGGPAEGVVWLALTMMDSLCPELAGHTGHVRRWSEGPDPELLFNTTRPYLSDLGLGVSHLGYVGTGPGTALVNDRMYH